MISMYLKSIKCKKKLAKSIEHKIKQNLTKKLRTKCLVRCLEPSSVNRIIV